MNPYLYEKYLEEKRNDMLAEAARRRIIRQASEPEQPLHSRFMLVVAQHLIRLGESIKKHYTAELPGPVSAREFMCPPEQ